MQRSDQVCDLITVNFRKLFESGGR